MGAVRLLLFTATVSLSLFSIDSAWAWGKIGHETVAAIAYRHLDSNAKAKVDELIGSRDFASSALWADEVKRQPAWCHTSTYHFANVPEHSSYLDQLGNAGGSCGPAGDLIQALLKSETVLRDPKTNSTDKAHALRFMIHFVGDLHQPLHLGRPEDRGGNEIRLNWNGRNTNLHAIWDTTLIYDGHPELSGHSDDEQLEWYTNYLDGAKGPAESPVDLNAWIEKSVSYTPQVYTGYKNQSAYVDKSIRVIDSQVREGGYHLAAWLNAIFSGKPISPENRKLRADMNSACPNFESTIRLRTNRLTPHAMQACVSADPDHH